MLRLAVTLVALAALTCAAGAGALDDSWIRGASSVAVNDDATALFTNPAGLAMHLDSNTYLAVSAVGEDVLGAASAAKTGPLSFGFERRYLWEETADGLRPGGDAVDTYTLGLGLGEPRRWTLGFDYRWIREQGGERRRAGAWDVGLMIRPTRALSIGAVVRNATGREISVAAATARDDGDGNGEARSYVLGVAARPAGNRLTFMADASLVEDRDVEDATYTAGLEAELLDGVVLRGSMRSFANAGARDEEMSVGLWLNARHLGAGASITTFDDAAEDIVSAGFVTSNERMRSLVRPSGRIARIRIHGPLADTPPGWSLFGGSRSGAQRIVREIDRAAKDPSVACLLLDVGSVGDGFFGGPSALLEEIRGAIVRARTERGKKIVTYLETGAGAGDYYIACAADEIVMTPSSGIWGLGNFVTIMRHTKTTEKIGVEWDFLTAGSYKSTFHSTGPGPLTNEQREAVEGIVDDVYRELVSAVAEGRGLTREEAQAICDGRVITPPDALESGLVDRLGFFEDAKAAAAELVGRDVPDDPEAIGTVDVSAVQDKSYDWNYGPAIAIVGAYGSIVVGEGGTDRLRGGRSIGSETLVKSLRHARKSDRVKAVVLRIDSGGGSGLASDLIWREAIKLAEAKPLVVSMAGFAASGGYLIACPAERVFADGGTITGSIGVVAAKPVFAELYDKIETTHETIKRGEHADMLETTRHITDDEQEMLQGAMDWFYEDFLEKVSDARKIPIDELRPLAEGRVYTGRQALPLGLIDEIGGLEEALEYACERVGVPRDQATILHYRERAGMFDALLAQAVAGLHLDRILNFASGEDFEVNGLRVTDDNLLP